MYDTYISGSEKELPFELLRRLGLTVSDAHINSITLSLTGNDVMTYTIIGKVDARLLHGIIEELDDEYVDA